MTVTVMNSVIKNMETPKLPDLNYDECSKFLLASEFNDYFSCNGRHTSLKLPAMSRLRLPDGVVNSFELFEITDFEIHSKINALPTGRAAVNGEVTVHTLKSNIEIISMCIEKIFNRAICSGTYSDLLNKTKVTPI